MEQPSGKKRNGPRATRQRCFRTWKRIPRSGREWPTKRLKRWRKNWCSSQPRPRERLLSHSCKVIRSSFQIWLVGALGFVLMTSCAPVEPRPEGVGRGIIFSVTPLYPHSYEIVAGGSRLRDATELKEAWHKKAVMVAKG